MMSDMSQDNSTYCRLEDFARTYESLHGPLSFLVCVFGSVANILNICVLTTKEMRWPTNLILTGLAIADLFVMLEYLPFTYHRYLDTRNKHATSFTYNWAVFMKFHAFFTQVFHFISCCLTVVLAIWRYITITNPHSTRAWCNMHRTLTVIVLTYILCPIICSPIYISLQIVPYNHSCDSKGRLLDEAFKKNYSGLVQLKTIYFTTADNSDHYRYASLWIYGVVIKLVPCILLTHLSWRLISVLLETKKRRKLLLRSDFAMRRIVSGDLSTGLSFHDQNLCHKDEKHRDKDRQADRTSGMLLAVLLLFLVTEFPQGILGLLSVIIGERFEVQCYRPLGDVMDILALTNSAINFILYCTMSRQFRSTFREVFRPNFLQRWIPYNLSGDRNGITEKTQLSHV